MQTKNKKNRRKLDSIKIYMPGILKYQQNTCSTYWKWPNCWVSQLQNVKSDYFWIFWSY